MSKPNNPGELFPSVDPSGDFGRDEGMVAYFRVAGDHPDWTVEQIASQAVRLQMIINGRFDVHDTLATEAVVEALGSNFDIPS